MVQPAPPNITEPLSSCSRRVRLDGMVRAAVVDLRGTAGRQLGRWTATWPDELFDFDPGVQLRPGELVWARQTAPSGEVSSWTTYPQATQAAAPSTPMFDLPVVACAPEVSVSSVTPGSLVTVLDQTAKADVGSTSGGITENVKLTRVVDPIDVLQLRATPCGGLPPGPLSTVPTIEKLRTLSVEDRRLPQVELEMPLRACQRLLTVRHGQPGTRLILKRGDGSELAWSLHAGSEETLRIDELHENEDVQWWVTQSGTPCDVLDSEPTTTKAVNSKPPQPRVVAAPCPGSPQLQLGGLVKSATVRLRVDGVEVRELVAPADSCPMDIGDLNLVLGQVLTVVQRLCHDWSDPSPDVAVSAAWDRQPVIAEPLEACSTVVVVNDVSPGALVVVLDLVSEVEGELGRTVADGTTAAVHVAPLLPDHTIVVRVVGCRPADLKALVQPDRERLDPILQQAYVGTRTAVVTQVSTGTRVDVSVNGHHGGTAIATGPSVDVTLDNKLADGDTVEVLARRCNIPRSSKPRPADALPVPAYTLLQPGGADCGGGNWASGRVEAIVATPGDVLVLGCTNSGVWISHPDGSAEPVSMTWPSAEVVALASDPSNVMHVFAATRYGLHESDPTAPDPLHTWKDIPLPPTLGGELRTVVVSDQRIVLVAGSGGIAWAPIPGPGAPWALSEDPSMRVSWTGAAPGPDGSLVLAAASIQPPPPAPGVPPVPVIPGRLARGAWSPAAGTFTWTDNAGTAPPAFTARMGRTVMTSCPADRNHLYALAANGLVGPDAATLLGVLHSPDGGRNWACHHFDPNDLDQFAAPKPWDMGTQAGANLAVVAHPLDPARVLIAGRNERLLGSTDFCATFDAAGYPRVLGPTFHADNRALNWDMSTGQLRVLVGGDGGIYVSTDADGHAFNSSRSRGLSTLMVDRERVPALASAPDVPGSCCIGLQDNDEAATTAGSVWRQKFAGGDGKHQIMISGRFLLHNGNDAPPLQWSEVSSAGVGPNVEVGRPPADPGGSRPTFERILNAVVAPAWRNVDGHLLVAYAAEVLTGVDQARLYGIFEDPDAGAGRFFGVQLAVLTGVPIAVASFDGRTAVVTTQTFPNLVPHVYRFDAATGVLLESVIPRPAPVPPPAPPPAPSEVWGVVMTGPHSGAAIHDYEILVSDDLQVWTLMTLPRALPPVRVLAADHGSHPAALHVGTDSLSAVIHEGGAALTVATGLPVNSLTRHLSIVADANGDRWVYLGSYGWSVWRARLP
ncbi:hypothetical protein ACPPVT_16315 [Angustibacter sp. McL0619]|uniref:hypothetical protein n=1 Tax=Angustibacter sp. McL0619 TaxID=3415676 RepID=UPI003CF4169F